VTARVFLYEVGMGGSPRKGGAAGEREAKLIAASSPDLARVALRLFDIEPAEPRHQRVRAGTFLRRPRRRCLANPVRVESRQADSLAPFGHLVAEAFSREWTAILGYKDRRRTDNGRCFNHAS